MDILDQADVAQEAFMREAFSRVGKPLQPAGIGMCINCGVALEGEQERWCDKECRDDWQRYGK